MLLGKRSLLSLLGIFSVLLLPNSQCNIKEDGMKKFVEWIKTPDTEDQRPYGGRYVGSLVSDFHRNLLYGGIFMYPKGEHDLSIFPCTLLIMQISARILASCASSMSVRR